MTVITRFAPSPTGMLHIGNARTALINWLYARNACGKFILRIDDTDLDRSTKEYERAIIDDMQWLGLTWDLTFSQSSRLERYETIKENLIKCGRLYECYETQSELEIKRKLKLASNQPPIYDRASLTLTREQKAQYEANGRRPHYRFLMKDARISWSDMVKGDVSYEANNISDPILIREDGSMTYMLCSVIDDIDYEISHIIRGEDHVTNTAVQIQIFEALNATRLPIFGHLSLIKSKDEKISKRIGGFEIASLNKDANIEAMTISSFLSNIGTSEQIVPFKDMKDLISRFNIKHFSRSPTIFIPEELERLNHKLLLLYEYRDIKDKLQNLTKYPIDEEFWLAVRPNIQSLRDVVNWWQICKEAVIHEGDEKEYLSLAAQLFPEGEITVHTWHEWTNAIANATGRNGKDLFLPLRLAITGSKSGPELKYLLPLIDKEKIMQRLVS